MKKRILLLSLALIILPMLHSKANAESYAGYRYSAGGGFYSNVTIPVSVAKDVNNTEKDNIFNVANTNVNKENLKVGCATRVNILRLVEIGNAGIMAAAKNGGIKKIHYVEVKHTQVYIPLGFIPIYVNGNETKVYGE